MATATPSSSPQDHLILAVVPKPSSAASRRLPPPCWSPDETVALIDAYRDKWYALRRGNLRATHWQEVADDVAVRCPPSSLCPPKTSVQCRHKMEKLRKRYRTELQRASMVPSGHRFSSSWVHFKRMDSMEKGTSGDDDDATGGNPMGDEFEEEDDYNEDDDDEDLYQSVVKRGVPQNHRSLYGSMSNGVGSGSSGVRIRYPGGPDLTPPTRSRMYGNFDGKPNHNPNPSFGSSRVMRDEYPERSGLGKRTRGYDDNGVGKKKESNSNSNPVGELVEAIKSLGDGFVRMERMKMDMARELESMRMEMEMKRTDMILESQQRIVEAFAKAFSDKRINKQKRMPSSDSQ